MTKHTPLEHLELIYSPDEYKQIPGFSDYYVTIDGNVFSTRVHPLRRTVKGFLTTKSRYRTAPNLKAGEGYCQVNMRMDNGKGRTVFVHKLVAEAFVPNPADRPIINHIDGDKGNNKASNLEWVSAKEHCNHVRGFVASSLEDQAGKQFQFDFEIPK